MECLFNFLSKLSFLLILSGCHVVVSIASAYSPDYSYVNPRANVGIPYSIWVDENAIWIGGENGLVELRSEKIIDFSLKNVKAKSNWVTDICDFNKDKILVSVFGNGLYLIDKKSYMVERIDTGTMKQLGFWKISVGEKHFAISSLNNIAVYDNKTQNLVLNFADSDIPIANQTIDLVLDEKNQTIWWLDIRLGLSSYSLANQSWSHVNLPKDAGTIYTALKKQGEQLLIGTNKGLVIYDTKTRTPKIITERVNSDLSQQPTRTVFVGADGTIWVGAETLYVVDETAYRFVEKKYIKNHRRVSEFFIVMDVAQDQFANMYVVDTLNEFMVFSNLLTSTQLYRPKNLLNDIVTKTEFSNNSEIIVNSYNGLVSVDSSSNFNGVEPFKLIRGRDTHYLINKENQIWSVNENKIVDLGFTALPHDFFSLMEEGFLVGGKLFFLSGDESKRELYEVSGNRTQKVMDHVVVTAALSNWGSLLVAVNAVGVFEIDQSGNIRSLNLGIDHSYDVFSSIAVNGDLVILGTSGSGYFVFDYSQQKLIHEDATDQFVRDAISLDKYWLVATNRGLFAVGKAKGERIKLDTSFGIMDSDFDFDGISASSQQIFVKGDKHRYLIDKATLLKNLSNLSVDTHPIPLSSLEFSAIDSQDKADALRVLEGAAPKVKLPSFNYIARHLLTYEFMLDNGPNWQQLEANVTTVVLNQLTGGTHTLQLRVHDPRSYQLQPVTRLNIRVLPPWWRSWQAMVIYGVLLSFIIFITYWSYRKRIREQGAYLTSLVNEKNRVLEESNDSIKRMLQRKQTVFSNLSHELRTPLSLILGPLSQLKKSVTSAKALEHLQLAERNAGRIQVLLDQMLEVERLDHVKTLPVNECDIASVTQCILYDLSTLADMKQQTLNWQCTTKEKIKLYGGSLEKILMNLVSNAVKYTPRMGAINVSVRVDNLQLIIQVDDNGIGMTESERLRIFERYTRFNEGEQGAGVGLALVKELITANGGWINVVSQQDKGTRFTVTLPMLHHFDSDDVDTVEEPIVNEYELINADNKQAIILVVDDNQEMRHYLHTVLSINYTCLLANNGKHGLQIVEKIRPHLIITDYKMPVMDGLALVTSIRDDAAHAYIPIIMLSALGDSTSRVRGLQANIDCYLTKPFNEEALLLTVTNLLHREATHRSESNAAEEPANDWPLPTFESEREQQFYFKLMTFMEQVYGQENSSRSDVAQHMAMSERHLQRKIKAMFGKNFTDLLREFRMRKAKDMLEQGRQITQVVYDVGFTSPSYFSRSFKEVYDVTPSEYQKHNYKVKNEGSNHQ
ncbi:ATP-binding protein [Alteromonas sp. C1M14]|uniref:ATP-binding protein n=1 Tax=Alteromonas sp. C1M14 TaxID=2841567 RepID=UPI001C0900AE|nr:ATP-binding protein [Alteromonas sp. C1M14]MBU2980102.1 response regulator [Alteromonas sp. C1M14]